MVLSKKVSANKECRPEEVNIKMICKSLQSDESRIIVGVSKMQKWQHAHPTFIGVRRVNCFEQMRILIKLIEGDSKNSSSFSRHFLKKSFHFICNRYRNNVKTLKWCCCIQNSIYMRIHGCLQEIAFSGRMVSPFSFNSRKIIHILD